MILTAFWKTRTFTWQLVSSEEESGGGESDVWTEYGEEVSLSTTQKQVSTHTFWFCINSKTQSLLELSQVVEDKTGQDRVYTKWKPPRNKLTQEIQRKKGAKRKSIVPDASVDRFCEPGEF